MPCSLIALCIASGARSRSPGQVTAPRTILACRNSFSSRSTAKTPASAEATKPHLHRVLDAVVEAHPQPKARQRLDIGDAPGRPRTDRRDQLSGAIFLGVCRRVHRSQSSISSALCSEAHSNTKPSARLGKLPSMTSSVRMSISASCVVVGRKLVEPDVMSPDQPQLFEARIRKSPAAPLIGPHAMGDHPRQGALGVVQAETFRLRIKHPFLPALMVRRDKTQGLLHAPPKNLPRPAPPPLPFGLPPSAASATTRSRTPSPRI